MDNFIKTADPDWYKQRVYAFMFSAVAVFALLGVRLLYLQGIKGDEYRRLSETNSIRLQRVNPVRGQIFDRDGRLLVEDRPAFALSITLKDAKPLDRTLAQLSKYTGVSVEAFSNTIGRQKGMSFYKPVVLINDIGRDALAAIEVHRYELPGVDVDVRPIRHYVEGSRAAHFIGYLSEINSKELESKKKEGYVAGDFIGKCGVEKIYESYLNGESGGRQVEVNARGQMVRVLKTVPAKPGNNVYLTLDSELQKKGEELLEGKAGAIVAMDPKNGEILVSVSSPPFDPNIFVEGLGHDQWQALVTNPLRPLENKVVHAEYPPASVYKIVVALAGLEEGVISSNSTFFCPGGYRFGNRVYRCWRKSGHGTMNLTDAIAMSCDVFFYQVGQQLGVDRLAWYARGCGLGTQTGIETENESAGLIPTATWKWKRFGEKWHAGETLSIAIGQGYNLVTPLQLVVLTSAVANGGIRYMPQIVKSVQTAEGETVYSPQYRVTGRLPVTPETLAKVRHGLHEVVWGRSGTARIAQVEGMEISGKTGTAQVYSRKSDDKAFGKNLPVELRDHAWFVAYAPAQEPRIAVAVMVEHGEHGSSAAAPLARDLIKAYLLPPEIGAVDEAPDLPVPENEQRNAQPAIIE
ncbi:MAG: penicillin-binding protein 2 [Desulfobacterales bacterium]|nr:penicillin-binding protein 2 [Desulfobacterales bacterium]